MGLAAWGMAGDSHDYGQVMNGQLKEKMENRELEADSENTARGLTYVYWSFYRTRCPTVTIDESAETSNSRRTDPSHLEEPMHGSSTYRVAPSLRAPQIKHT